ncbi:hypothetical protein [Flavobacterium sp.]|uniref:hypothetical protein n=1 Tax=Flavobacterium sp. TaxID=239 RepID=UPI0025F41F6A|nr:hypothetical protein [Flavobacterium sp.]
MLLLITQPTVKTGSIVLKIANKRFLFRAAEIKGSFSLPTFYENFDSINGIINSEMKSQLVEIVN